MYSPLLPHSTGVEPHPSYAIRIVPGVLVSRGTQNALRRLTFQVALAVLTAILLLGAGRARAETQTGARCAQAGEAPGEATLHYMRSSMLCLINRVRERYGLEPLDYNVDLRRSATGHSNDMVAHDYFSHYGPDGSTLGGRVARAGYLARVNTYFIGENIGGGKGPAAGSPIAVFRSWMHSPPHRANILDPSFHDFGVGVSRGYPYGGGRTSATYTLDLGMRH
jgi:uncharacterized protein YkwD